MNALDRDLGAEAVVHYGDGEFVVLKPGRHVLCAVTKKPIPLDALRYWDPVRQEAYASPQIAFDRWKANYAKG
ncbi:MAG: DUF2093 domain-containing protein [Caulobacteraceae bacterium]|nr:DUF2093 domain-containing protein [Caulobacteraceae bacterium]